MSEEMNTELATEVALITEDEKNGLKQLSAYALPNSPADHGMGAAQTKPAFWKPLVQGDSSVSGLLNRVIKDVNDAFGNAKTNLTNAFEAEATNRDAAISAHNKDGNENAHADIRKSIADLADAIGNCDDLANFRGRFEADADPSAVILDPKNGDFVLVGDKLFIYDGVKKQKWVSALNSLTTTLEVRHRLTQDELTELKHNIGDLKNIMNFRGVFDELDDVESPKAGDVCIVDDYEYAYGGKWQSQGTTTEENTHASMDDITHPGNGDTCVIDGVKYIFEGEWKEFGIGSTNAAEIAKLTKAFADESKQREKDDTALGQRITIELADEAKARGQAETALAERIAVEENARADADAELQVNIDAETAARLTADTTEQAERKAADDALTQRINRNDKRLTNIEQGLPADNFLADNAAAFVKNVPNGMCSSALVSRIGGASYRSKNLMPYPYRYNSGDVRKGLTFTTYDDQSFSLDGTCENDDGTPAYFTLAEFTMPAGNYVLWGTPTTNQGAGSETFQMYVAYGEDFSKGFYSYSGKLGMTFSEDTPVKIMFTVYYGQNVPNIHVYPMLVKVDDISSATEISYVPYFAGLCDANVTALKVRGTNCFLNRIGLNYVHPTSGIRFEILEDGSIKVTGQNTTEKEAQIQCCSTGVYLTAGLYRCAGLEKGVEVMVHNFTLSKYQTITSTSKGVSLPDGMCTLYFRITAANTTDYTMGKIFPVMVYKVSSTEDADKELVPYKLTEIAIPAEIQALEGYGQGNPDNSAEYNYIDWSALEFVAVGHIVDGAWVAYDAPKITDVSAYLTPDNYIEVEGGGTITMANEHELAVPNEITYQIKEVTA